MTTFTIDPRTLDHRAGIDLAHHHPDALAIDPRGHVRPATLLYWPPAKAPTQLAQVRFHYDTGRTYHARIALADILALAPPGDTTP